MLCRAAMVMSRIQPLSCIISAYSNIHYFKYADDTALVGLLSDGETDYRSDIDDFVSWCVGNCFELNVVKTKEFVIDFPSGVHHPTPVNINGQHIAIVHSYKYLGTTFDGKLRWDDNTKQTKIVLPEKTQGIAHRQKHFICVP